MQRLFGLLRVRYFGVVKTHAQMVMAALSQTLLKAANTITYQQINLNNHRAQTENANPPIEIAADRKTPLVKL
jgi:hypothetical protein